MDTFSQAGVLFWENTMPRGVYKRVNGKFYGNSRHGKSNEKIYKIWGAMKERCLNKDRWAYKYYGARGIKVCERWMKFENFYEDMGDRPDGKTLDRVDNNGDYEPNNCRWESQKRQMRNTRRAVSIGGYSSIIDASEATGLNKGTIRSRIKRGSNCLQKPYNIHRNRLKTLAFYY